jgi:polysaccharide deacetylase family protein (PEP-CTERM system associated)
MSYHILLTIDVEDWFQVENFKPWIPFASWDSRELRVEKNTHKLLDLFDSLKVVGPINPINPSNPKATFFILGWLAERLPHLVREIRARGHEVASHGYGHELCSGQSCRDLEKDLCDSRKLLEDIIGDRVYGYRAPSFSISDDVLSMIAEAGYLYDSSYNSFTAHGRYGKISTNGSRKKGIAHVLSENFYELPVSNLRLGKKVLPWGGGAYFRLVPAAFFRSGVRRILDQQGAYLFYCHPWELDPDQPRVEEASANFKFRHYSNLAKTRRRLERLIERFAGCRFTTCADYLGLGFVK